MDRLPEERLAELLSALPPAPEAWVAAAQELPRVRAELKLVLARAEADQGFRAALLADPEGTLAASGHAPSDALLAELRERLGDA
jgi:hypothetical protein